MKTYVISGATSGIGRALVEYYAKENIVFAGYRNEDKKQELVELSENIIPFYIDFAKPETIAPAYSFIKSKTDKIDTLINVAGCVVAGAIEHISISEIKRQFDVNVFGHIEFSQGLLSLLNNGKIINISSMSSFGIFPFVSPYGASKRALDIMFNSFGLENKQNVKVVSIKPGVIATPLWLKSVNENKETINNCVGYDKETNYLQENAKRNEVNGLPVKKVLDKIVKVEKMPNPKPSYCIGIDSIAASIVAKLPQTIINKIIGLKLKRLQK